MVPRPMLSPYLKLVLALSKRLGPSLNVMIVGANDGITNDPFHKCTQFVNDFSLLLVEPQYQLNHILLTNYSSVQKKMVVNCLVGSPGLSKFYVIPSDKWHLYQPPYSAGWPFYRAPTGIASTQKHVLLDNIHRYSTLLVDDIVSYSIPSLPIIDICKQFSSSFVPHILQIDAEGAEIDILNTLKMDPLPLVIYFEYKHLPPDFTVTLRLLFQSYSLIRYRSDIIAIHTSLDFSTGSSQ